MLEAYLVEREEFSRNEKIFFMAMMRKTSEK